ncbi:hypothetical protein C1H46_012456 [Malus baccata]|uniref:Uncharacterized protein n=1 Tax=Malus baccata TaxID=106549 RepID=A0A540MSS6_MALBA|nr:hypothetical protein C1H46_012456 [Malus baccata]
MKPKISTSTAVYYFDFGHAFQKSTPSLNPKTTASRLIILDVEVGEEDSTFMVKERCSPPREKQVETPLPQSKGKEKADAIQTPVVNIPLVEPADHLLVNLEVPPVEG